MLRERRKAPGKVFQVFSKSIVAVQNALKHLPVPAAPPPAMLHIALPTICLPEDSAADNGSAEILSGAVPVDVELVGDEIAASQNFQRPRQAKRRTGKKAKEILFPVLTKKQTAEIAALLSKSQTAAPLQEVIRDAGTAVRRRVL
eukprot:m.236035 g.236035  ORF g.236035 m.236035 type:complete len:145 (-) comp22485_c0_seq27:275-709(-)